MPVLELRQYTLRPGMRTLLIDIFEAHLIESQEACAMSIQGQFRDVDRPDRFVWLREFPDMAARAEALGAFYGGPVWAAHRDAANATMLKFDDVLLLKPAWPGAGLVVDPARRPAFGSPEPAGRIVAEIRVVAPDAVEPYAAFFRSRLLPVLEKAGTALRGAFVSEPARNSYPGLPVREGETVFVWLAGHAGEQAQAAHRQRLAASAEWRAAVAEGERSFPGPATSLRLAPTPRSLLRG